MSQSKASWHVHDLFFKEQMAYPGVARDFFVAQLTTDILNAIDLSTLKSVQSEHVIQSTKVRQVDMLYEIQYKYPSKKSLFLIVEQQTQPRKDSVLRLL